MASAPLSRIAIERNLARLRPELGNADQKRLSALPALIGDDRRILLGKALAALYPTQQREAALTAFRQLRARLTAAAEEAKLNFALEVDTQTRTAPDERVCWFSGDDSAAEAAIRFAETETRGTVRVGQDAVLVGKRPVRYFVSYAHAAPDDGLKTDLLRRLKEWFDSASDYRFEAWQDSDIDVGSEWHKEIQAAIQACDFGLLLVSPAFLASTYITREELTHFVAADPLVESPDKRPVPVALRSLRFDGSMDMKGLERRQIFKDANGKAFQERTTDKTKHDFAKELFGAITRLLARHFAASQTQTAPLPAGPEAKTVTLTGRPSREMHGIVQVSLDAHRAHRLAWQRDELAHELHDLHFVNPHGRSGTMNKLEEEAPDGERHDALEFLLAWAAELHGPTCCALLGSVGIGKTTTCKAFAHRLLERRETDPTTPLPIYLDLRHLGDAARDEPDLKATLATLLRRSWQGGQTEAPLEPDELIRLVRQEGAIVIYDGLDEVLVHLSPRAGQQFTRELLRILPPSLWPGRRRADEPGQPGRVLVTCRTHYFRSLRDQQTHLTAEDRDDVRDADYRVFVLLPFSDEQVREYLTQTFPQRDVEPVLSTIHAVHNLTELASRPYTLSLIAHALPQIERWQLEGRRVTGVDLYRHMVQSWLERDDGKHELEAEHKQRIMEHVAAELWRSGGRTWTARQMEDWLAEFLEETPDVARHYRRKDLAVLKKDLRTATFLVGGGRRHFRFAHTSLQEFFLAGFLLRALREGRIEAWDMERPSTETLDFLGQMLLGETAAGGTTGRPASAVAEAVPTARGIPNAGTDPALATLRAMRGAYRPRISELAFFYVLFALARDYPAPSPAGFVLDGADLREWEIEGAPERPMLDLRNASFHQARLGYTRFRHVDLDDADFSGADLLRTELNDGRGRGARFTGSTLIGTVFRDFDLSSAGFDDTAPYRTQFLRCTLPLQAVLPAGPPGALYALCQPHDDPVAILQHSRRLATLGGHTSGVTACAFDPNGKRIVSASGDNTLRIWDADSGECTRTFSGHTNRVTACAFDPNGKRIVSASGDNTLRIWDADSGECTRTLSGHTNRVTACAFDPNGKRIVSASGDNTLRIWDADSGECTRTLSGHTNRVTACAFDPNGKRIVSASVDNTLRIWDADSGECTRTLSGHTNRVTACAFDPNGKHIVSASVDNTLRIWDADSGECTRTLSGHTNRVTACAFDPNGKHIVSASVDNTLRIWDADSGECTRTLSGHTNRVTACAFDPNGKHIVSASVDNTLRIWDADSGECTGTLSGHTNPVTACAFDPNGKRIVSASADNTLRIWDADSGECTRTLSGHTNPVTACAFDPNGKRIVSASDDNTLRIWDADSGECTQTLNGHTDRVTACAFNPDGKRIVSAADDNTLRIWDADSGECTQTLNGHTDRVTACAFNPDGKRIVSASWDNTLRIWDADSGECTQTLNGHTDRVTACAFNPDGKRIVSASWDNTLRIWDADSGECTQTLNGHTDWVTACAFNPDGKRIVSAADDNTLRIWDASTGQELGFRIHMLGNGGFAVLAPDGSRAIQVSAEAWRDLGWLVPDAEGALTRYPAETFGPLPEYRP